MSAAEQEQTLAPRIGVKEAVRLAREALEDIEAYALHNLRLEEARRDREKGRWLITFGLDVVVESPPGNGFVPRNPLAALLDEPRTMRTYRVVVLDDRTGEFDELRMRES